MVTRDPNHAPLLADLLESAVAAAHPDRMSGKLRDHGGYRMPLDQLDRGVSDSVNAGPGQWPDALKAAYEDGYDPILWLGRGASSEVWRCVDRSFGREVAIKVPFHDLSKNSDTVVAALQAEAELLGRLHHPGIVHAVRRSGEGRDAYLALDFIDGEDLLEHSRLLKLDLRARLLLFTKVLDSVAYLHAKGIVHGDLKPDHVLVRENDQPVLIDFGLSSSDSSSSLRLSDGTRLGGSGRFRAPEIANGSAVSTEPQQDVFSLGVILRELQGDLELAGGGEVLQEVIDRSIEIDPDARWEDAGAMLEAIRSVLSPARNDDAVTGKFAPSGQATPRHLTVRWAVALGALAAVLLIGLVLVINTSNAGGSDDQNQGNQSDSRYVAQASLFDLALQGIYSGQDEAAAKQLDQIEATDPDAASSWEHRHIQAVGEDRGEVYPLGRLPYSPTHASCVDYDPVKQAVAYFIRGQGNFELWFRPFNGPARKIANSVETLRGIALSPGSERVATIDSNGKVLVWTLQEGGVPVLVSHEIPRQADDRIVWFAADGLALFLYSSKSRALECWSIENPLPAKPKFVINDCDHAYRLPSGEGSFMVATAGDNTANGQTQLRVLNPKGEVIRQLELEDSQVPASVDSAPGPKATVCLGMPNGFVRIHRAEAGGWQKPCDLGLNQAITAVVYSAVEQRAFAYLARIHVIASDGRLVMRLGDRNARHSLVTRLDFDNKTATLSCTSIREFWRCVAD